MQIENSAARHSISVVFKTESELVGEQKLFHNDPEGFSHAVVTTVAFPIEGEVAYQQSGRVTILITARICKASQSKIADLGSVLSEGT
jgi:hypothetical protein